MFCTCGALTARLVPCSLLARLFVPTCVWLAFCALFGPTFDRVIHLFLAFDLATHFLAVEVGHCFLDIKSESYGLAFVFDSTMFAKKNNLASSEEEPLLDQGTLCSFIILSRKRVLD